MRMMYALIGLGVGIAVLGYHDAKAEEAAKAVNPDLCQMVEAFDQALQLRFYKANFAPDRFNCRFYGASGCPYSVTGAFTIKVTHVSPIGCDGDGRCEFLARQICEAGGTGFACKSIMSAPQSLYRVSGRFSETDAGAWRLTDWKREPGGAWGLENSAIADRCPTLAEQLPG